MDNKNELHIWQALIPEAEPHAEALTSFLSEEEKAQGSRFVDPKHAQRYILAHGILRDILSRYLNQPPNTIVFTKGSHGKPYVTDTEVKFNMTHSQDCVLVAVTMENDVGIDVECIERDHRFDDLVERFFSPQEFEAYRSYESDEDRRLAFYRGWTRKEAYLKAIGLGLSFPLHKFAVSLAPDERHALLHVENDTTERAKWTVFSFDVGPYYLASVAIKASIKNIQNRTWSFSPAS